MDILEPAPPPTRDWQYWQDARWVIARAIGDALIRALLTLVAIRLALDLIAWKLPTAGAAARTLVFAPFPAALIAIAIVATTVVAWAERGE